MDKRIEQTLKNLKRNHMTGYFLERREQLLPLMQSLIPEGQAVGCGDSVTLEDLGVFDFLRSGKYLFYDKFKPGLTREERHELYGKNFSADTFVTGTNALTIGGELVNIDGNESRVAPMIYGPKQVIVVVGINKITENLEEAMKRARNIAAPLDAKRLKKGTPCETLGKCVDCHHPQRICNDFVVIAGQFNEERIKVVIMNEALGF